MHLDGGHVDCRSYLWWRVGVPDVLDVCAGCLKDVGAEEVVVELVVHEQVVLADVLVPL